MGLRFRDRVVIRARVRDRCGFGFVCFSWSVLKLRFAPAGKTSAPD